MSKSVVAVPSALPGGMEAGMGGDDWRSTFKLVRGH
mgnify:CR=1 FL=1